MGVRGARIPDVWGPVLKSADIHAYNTFENK
jgi:hypothetical protein